MIRMTLGVVFCYNKKVLVRQKNKNPCLPYYLKYEKFGYQLKNSYM